MFCVVDLSVIRSLPQRLSSCSFECLLAVVALMVCVQARPVMPNAIGAGRGLAIVPLPWVPAARLPAFLLSRPVPPGRRPRGLFPQRLP